MSMRSRLLLAACALLCSWSVPAAPASAVAAADFRADALSIDARDAARWVLASRDHRGLPFAIVDKRSARIHVFDAAGDRLGDAPVLRGLAPGDRPSPPLDDRRAATLAPAERTTPAGRFLSSPGRNDKGEPVVWFDHAAALAIHRLRPAPAAERRPARLQSPRPGERRISFGCIVVPVAFYETVIAPSLGRSRSVVYVLPEQRTTHAFLDALMLAGRPD